MAESPFQQLRTKLRRSLKDTAHFYPIDVHCHSPISRCFGRKDGESEIDIRATPHDIASEACKKGLYLLAITDHNRCENADPITAAADAIRSAGENQYPNNNLVVLPGVEISVDENSRTVHLLAIFPERTSLAQIETVLDDTGVEPNPKDRGENTRVNRKRLAEVIERIHARNGLAILAHVNSAKGYREEMRRLDWPDDRILREILALRVDAVEVHGSDDARHFVLEERQIPCLVGSDAHYVRDIGGKTCISRVKMTCPSFADFQRALHDPATRIRLESPSVPPSTSILGIMWQGGFLDRQIVPFTSNLNCLIGGRGTGKSAVVETIRYLFDQPLPPDRQKEINKLRSYVLKDCTATLLFQDRSGQCRVLQRTLGDSATKIMDLDGTERADIDLAASDAIRVSLYGWSEIEGIARDFAQQLTLIDSFIPDTRDLKTGEDTALDDLRANARDVQNQIDAIEREASQAAGLAELTDELKKIGAEETPEERNKANADFEGDLLRRIHAALATMRETLDNVTLLDPLRTLSAEIGEATTKDKFLSPPVFAKIREILNVATGPQSPIEAAKAKILAALDDLDRDLTTAAQPLDAAHQAADSALAVLLAATEQPELQAVAHHRQQVRAKIAQKEAAARRRAEAQAALDRLSEERAKKIAQLLALRHRLFQCRKSHIADIQRQLPTGQSRFDIEIQLEEQANRERFRDILTTCLVGLPRHWHQQRYPEKIACHFTPVDFARALARSDSAAIQQASFEPEEAVDLIRHFANNRHVLMAFESCECSDRVRILFDVEGERRPVEHLSPGQRCTALLPIILLETDTPLVIDQPEDNLDNQFVFELVVETLRGLKEKRQIIVATHNPNIPVSGDAENILVFRPEGDTGKLASNGSIDYPAVVNDVKSIMEGGETAFLVRMRKYGLPRQ